MERPPDVGARAGFEPLERPFFVVVAPDEAPRLVYFAQRLLEMLLGSDFMLAWLDHPVLCTLHHHRQLWWQTTDPRIEQALEQAVQQARS